MDSPYPPYRTEIPDYGIEPSKPVYPPQRIRLNVFLFLLTVGTTLTMGAGMEGAGSFSELYLGIPFAGTLLGIIGLHEFGHYYMCKRHGVNATLPYFIPFPNIIGTLGAVIKIKSPITNNKALFDIGIAGPIAGFVVAIPAIWYGLETSEVRELSGLQGGLSFGDPLLLKIAAHYILGDIPDGFTIYISSVGFAGWVGLLVTAFNLLPIGQLDGGHIAYSLIGKKQHILGYIAFAALFPLSFFWWGWLIWVVMALFMKIKHPAGQTHIEPLDTKRKVLGLFAIVMFVLCFIPVPIQGMDLMQLVGLFAG